jgi:hypothetical protein
MALLFILLIVAWVTVAVVTVGEAMVTLGDDLLFWIGEKIDRMEREA